MFFKRLGRVEGSSVIRSSASATFKMFISFKEQVPDNPKDESFSDYED
jgi:hypothetical protein